MRGMVELSSGAGSMRSMVEMSNGGRLPEEHGGDEQWGQAP